MNLAIFLPNWVGDLVMATPALRAVRRHLGRSAQIVGIVRPNLAGLLAGTDWLDAQWCFDPRSQRADWGRLALLGRMRHARCDMALLLTNSLGTALMAWLGGAKQRIGYVRDARGPLLTGRLYPLRGYAGFQPVPMVDYYLALAAAIGCPAESPRLELAVTEGEQRLGERVWKTLGLRNDGRVVALNFMGAYGAAKLWPTGHAGELAHHIVRHLDCDVLLLCGPGERPAAMDVVRWAQSPRVFTLPQDAVGLGATKACLARSRLLVSTDSGPRHIAAALGKPVITLLGPTLPDWIRNPTVAGSMLQADVDCLGCGKRTCPVQHHRCMRDLRPERVFEEVAALLDERLVRAA
jgi:heptosyltransferase-2